MFLKTVLVALLFWLTCAACSSTKTTPLENQAANNFFLDSILESYLTALNEKDFERLESMYHDDFKSLNPVGNYTKEELMVQMKKNLKVNDKMVQANIIEKQESPTLSYLLLDYKILNEESEILFQQALLQIWKKNDAHTWQLYRILFYQPKKVPEF